MSGMSRADRPVASRSAVRAMNGMVATAQPLATEAGVRALRRGGTAVDAAIAANAVLAVVEPVSCGLGGDLFAMVWDPATGRLSGLDASGRAPRSLRLEDVRPGPDGTIPLRSPQSWTVPGAVSGWFALHARHGRLEAEALLEDARRLAVEGFPVSEVIASAWASGASHAHVPGFAEVFLPGGHAPREGEVFRNPALGRTLGLVMEGGADAFYRGEPAAEVAAYAREVGGALAEQDFASHACTWVEPLSTTFAGHELWELPPATQGLAALEMLNIAEAAGIEGLSRSHADWWHVLVESKKLAFEDRARRIGDPAGADLRWLELASKEHARQRAASMSRSRASDVGGASLPVDLAETTYLATADAEGMMVSLIQSNYTGFGSGHAVPSLGFSLQNRGALFSLSPSHPNALGGGRRPFHTIIPAFLTRDGAPVMAFGVMGGDMQPQGHVQVVVSLLAGGMGLQEAGDAPRFHHGGSTEPTGTVGHGTGELHLEPEVPLRIAEELERRGHDVSDRPWSYGGYQAVARDLLSGALSGATERRKDGCALGW